LSEIGITVPDASMLGDWEMGMGDKDGETVGDGIIFVLGKWQSCSWWPPLLLERASLAPSAGFSLQTTGRQVS
jgi:hypothetical protein